MHFESSHPTTFDRDSTTDYEAQSATSTPLVASSVDLALADYSVSFGRATFIKNGAPRHDGSAAHIDIHNAFQDTISALETQINSAPAPDFIALLTSSSELKSAFDSEIQTEQGVEHQLARLQALVTHLENTILRPAQERYQSATGLLDSRSRLMDLTWGLSALASFGLAAGLILTYEHAILHGVSHFVHGVLGHSALSYVASVASQFGALVAQGTACFIGALAGPSILGFIKTVGGRCVRAISPSNNRTFKELSEQSSSDLSYYQALTAQLADSMSRFQPNLTRFYARNEDVRALISSRLESLSSDRGAISPQECTDLHKLSSALGSSELITLMRCLNLEKRLRELSLIDFRSPELVEASSSSRSELRGGWGLSRGLILSVKSVFSLFRSATTIGERSAINATRKSRDKFESLPNNPVTDIVAGVGSGVSTTIEHALRAGTQPGKTTYSFLKGVLGLSKSLLVGGEKEGPRLETLLKVMFDLTELEKGNRIRFFSKLIPSLIRAATQKPIIMEQAEEAEELEGKVSPKGIGTKLAENRGSYAAGRKMFGDLLSLAYDTSKESIVRYGYLVPLEQIKASIIVDRLYPALAKWASDRLDLYELNRHETLREKMQKELKSLSNGEALARLQDNELDVYVIEKFIEYTYRPNTSILQGEISALLHYWELRRKAAWHETSDAQQRHDRELAELHQRFPSIRKILHVKSNIFSPITKGLLFGKSDPAHPQLAPEEVLMASFVAWATPLEGAVKPVVPTILEASADGMLLALLDQNGSLKLLKAGEVRALFGNPTSGAAIRILSNADHARVTAFEMALSMRLEPFQRRTLIEIHQALSSGSLSREEACERLIRAGIPRDRLSTDNGQGILHRGLLG